MVYIIENLTAKKENSTYYFFSRMMVSCFRQYFLLFSLGSRATNDRRSIRPYETGNILWRAILAAARSLNGKNGSLIRLMFIDRRRIQYISDIAYGIPSIWDFYSRESSISYKHLKFLAHFTILF